MTLSELIAKLVDLEIEHGALEVCARDDDGFDLLIEAVGVVSQEHGSDLVMLETRLG